MLLHSGLFDGYSPAEQNVMSQPYLAPVGRAQSLSHLLSRLNVYSPLTGVFEDDENILYYLNHSRGPWVSTTVKTENVILEIDAINVCVIPQ